MSRSPILLLFGFLLCAHEAQAISCDRQLKLEAVHRPLVVVVDAASSGRFLGPAFKRRGCRILHVQSAPVLAKWAAKSLDTRPFEANVIHRSSLADTVREIRSRESGSGLIVVPGAETGVELAEELNAFLRLPTGNDPASWERRKDKFEMNVALNAAGLRTARQTRVTRVEDALEFAKKVGFPIVVKPSNSSGGNLVFIADSAEEVGRALEGIIGMVNGDGRISNDAVIQEHLEGVEYAVNGASSNGIAIVTDVIRYEKERIPGFGNTYKSDTLTALDREIESAIGYVKRALPALGFLNGAFHFEVKVDRLLGPALVELNARPCGGGLPQWTSVATGQDYFDIVAQSYLDRTAFQSLPQIYTRHKFMKGFMIRTPTAGLKLKSEVPTDISRLPGVVEVVWFHPPDQPLPETKDYDSSAARVIVLHEDPTVVEQTITTLETWMQSRNLFQPAQ